MLSAEDIDAWNAKFPDCQIKQTDLKNPTQHFLTRALISYLRFFGYDVTMDLLQASGAENSRERRLFLISLTQYIDHIYKVTDKSLSFTYMDLIHPTVKKTMHLLRLLLNYLHYFAMYRDNVFDKVTKALSQHADLTKKIEEKELGEKEEEMIKTETEQLKVQLELLKNEDANLLAEYEQLKNTKLEFEKKLRVVEENIEDLLKEKRTLEKRVVPDAEFRNLRAQLSKIEEKLTEKNLEETQLEQTAKDCVEHMKQLDNNIKGVERLVKLLPAAELKELIETDKRFAETKKAFQTLKEQRIDLQQLLEKHAAEGKKLADEEKAMNNAYREEKQQMITTAEQQQCNYKSYAERIENLQLSLNQLDCLYKEHLETRHFVEEELQEILGPLKQPMQPE